MAVRILYFIAAALFLLAAGIAIVRFPDRQLTWALQLVAAAAFAWLGWRDDGDRKG